MAKLKLHYDGWLALPATVRRRMGITTGDQLDMEWTDGGLLLRNPNAGSAPAEPEVTNTEPSEPEPVADKPKKPAPKRAAKAAAKPAAKTAQKTGGKLAASTIPKARGRKKSAAAS